MPAPVCAASEMCVGLVLACSNTWARWSLSQTSPQREKSPCGACLKLFSAAAKLVLLSAASKFSKTPILLQELQVLLRDAQ